MVLPIAFAQGIPKEEVSSVMLDSIFVDKSLGADYLRLTFKTKRAGDMEGILNTKEAVQKSLEYKGETGKRGNKIAQASKKRRV